MSSFRMLAVSVQLEAGLGSGSRKKAATTLPMVMKCDEDATACSIFQNTLLDSFLSKILVDQLGIGLSALVKAHAQKAWIRKTPSDAPLVLKPDFEVLSALDYFECKFLSIRIALAEAETVQPAQASGTALLPVGDSVTNGSLGLQPKSQQSSPPTFGSPFGGAFGATAKPTKPDTQRPTTSVFDCSGQPQMQSARGSTLPSESPNSFTLGKRGPQRLRQRLGSVMRGRSVAPFSTLGPKMEDGAKSNGTATGDLLPELLDKSLAEGSQVILDEVSPIGAVHGSNNDNQSEASPFQKTMKAPGSGTDEGATEAGLSTGSGPFSGASSPSSASPFQRGSSPRRDRYARSLRPEPCNPFSTSPPLASEVSPESTPTTARLFPAFCPGSTFSTSCAVTHINGPFEDKEHMGRLSDNSPKETPTIGTGKVVWSTTSLVELGINNKYQSIVMIPCYSSKSPEELRLEDYQMTPEIPGVTAVR